MQFVFDLHLLHPLLVHFSGVVLIIVATDGFGPRQCGFGIFQQRTRVIATGGINAHANRASGEYLVTVDQERLADLVNDFLRHDTRVVRQIDMAEHHHEFIPFHAAHHVITAHQ